MDTMRFEVKLDLANEDIGDGSIDSLVQQLSEVIAAAVEEKQIEIPEAEIIDYGVTRADEY
jgi:hypothetical protein